MISASAASFAELLVRSQPTPDRSAIGPNVRSGRNRLGRPNPTPGGQVVGASIAARTAIVA